LLWFSLCVFSIIKFALFLLTCIHLILWLTNLTVFFLYCNGIIGQDRLIISSKWSQFSFWKIQFLAFVSILIFVSILCRKMQKDRNEEIKKGRKEGRRANCELGEGNRTNWCNPCVGVGPSFFSEGIKCRTLWNAHAKNIKKYIVISRK
jgi:membrane protein implicated in regulation of membrane protease activity